MDKQELVLCIILKAVRNGNEVELKDHPLFYRLSFCSDMGSKVISHVAPFEHGRNSATCIDISSMRKETLIELWELMEENALIP